MATVTPDKLTKAGSYTAASSGSAGYQTTTDWYRIDWDVSTDTETTPIYIGKNKCVIITLGTVGTTVAGGSETLVLEASNPDGTFSDMGLSGFAVSTSDAMPAQQIFDCPQVIRLTGSGATSGVFNLWIEVQR
jgi:hypothetical protein